MARLAYTFVFYLLLPIILLRMLWRSRKAPAYRLRWAERFGVFPRPVLKQEVIWVHAVSVGESLAAAPLIKVLLNNKPHTSIVVTTTTPTGSDRIRHLFGDLPEDRVFHVYCPYDLPDCLWRFLKRIQPKVLIIMETELWPNTIAHCVNHRISVILANGRLSEKSAKAYKKIGWLIKPVFASISAAAVQAEADGGRMLALGLPKENCFVTGSIKFDLNIEPAVRTNAKAIKEHINGPAQSKVLIAASTHEGEEAVVLEAFKSIKQSISNSFLILVPRHPERFEDVAQAIRRAGLNFNRHSDDRIEMESTVLLGDTMGELLTLLGAADTAFIGGSLVPVGGHNLIEPAAWGLPIITGPHLFNFAEVSAQLNTAGGLEIVHTAEELSGAVITLWRDENLNSKMGAAALAVANNNRGALAKLINIVDKTIVQNPNG